MERGNWMLFLALVLGTYALVGGYLLRRLRAALETLGVTSPLPMDLGMALVCAYPAGRILEHLYPGGFSTLLILLGSFSLAFGIHALPPTLVLHLLERLNRVFPLMPRWVHRDPPRAALHGLLLCSWWRGGPPWGEPWRPAPRWCGPTSWTSPGGLPPGGSGWRRPRTSTRAP